MHIQKTIILGLILLCLPISGWAKSKVFVEKYSYNAGEADSKLTCRTVSLLEVKRLLLEKLGTYLETRTEVKDFQVTKDEIVALTAGIVKTEILDEKWNGETYTLTAKIEPNMRGALWGRGIAYMKTGDKQKGKRDIKRAADLGNHRAKKWIDSRKKRSLF